MTESKQGIFKDAFKQSFYKLSPRLQVKNPVMFVVYLGALVTSGLYVLAFFGIQDSSPAFTLSIAVILWLTLLFGNFAEAMA